MIFASRLKGVLVAVAALGTASGLIAGLARAVGPVVVAQVPAAPPATTPPEAITTAIAKPPPARPTLARGVVVDEAGRPVAGGDVRVDAFSDDYEVRGVTGADGTFAIPLRRGQVDGRPVLARSPDGRLGIARYGGDETRAEVLTRVVLKPAREVVVRVADASRAAVPGATVQVSGGYPILAVATTGPDGIARLAVPIDARVKWILAVDRGRGLDYAEFGAIDEHGRMGDGAPAGELPASVALALRPGRAVRIRAVDAAGKPLVGVGFKPSEFRMEGRRSDVSISGRIFVATTGPDGVATFDWLPPAKDTTSFVPQGEGYARRRILVEEAETGTVTASLARTETIRGRVTFPDGSPAAGFRVDAHGSGRGIDYGLGRTRTGADGSYELRVNSGEAYAVSVEDKDWAARSRLDVAVVEGRPVEGVDFSLVRGTLVRGRVTMASGNRPAPMQYIGLREDAQVALDGGLNRLVRRYVGVETDAQGRYAMRVGPGTYTTYGLPRNVGETITIKDEAELVRDYRIRPERGPITGRVVAGPGGPGVAGAKVVFLPVIEHTEPTSVTADAEGRFRAVRALERTIVHARNADGSLAAIVEIDAEAPEIVIPVAPTATATGRLLDPDGKPAANQEVMWGRRTPLPGENSLPVDAFGTEVVTDAEGRFALPALVVGQEYVITWLGIPQAPPPGPIDPGDFRQVQEAGAVRPERPGLVDLGTLRAGSYRPR